MESTKITESPINKQSFPQGSLISSRLPSHAVGNLLEVHEFLCRFQNVLGIEEPISFEKLEKELLGVGKSSILETVETFIHSVLLPDLLSELLDRTASAVKIKLDMLPVNRLTWPEVVRRYIMAYLLIKGRIDSENIEGIVVHNSTELFQCLQGDGGICCESLASVAGVDLDAQLLGRAIENVFGKLKKERNTLSMGITGTKGENGDRYGACTNDISIPEWVKVLEPVKKLPTNVGSRIRDCVYKALEKNPPEWAKNKLEASIAKDVYKGNACGPTKNAVKAVLDKVTTVAQRESGVPQRQLPLDTDIRRSERICKAIMKKCGSILCHVAANNTERDFSDFVGRSLNSNDSDVRVVFRSASTRPLDLQTIHLRLLHGTYGGSHEAFLEDVRELRSSLKVWINLMKTPVNKRSLRKLADYMSDDLELRFENEVAPFIKTLSEFNMNRKSTVEVGKELQEILTSIEIPETPWEMIICKVCGHGTDDENMLLCESEGCNAAYHVKCLNPPLSRIHEANWHCPTCAPCKQLVDNEPKGVRQILRHVDKSWEEASPLLDILTALEEREYWELEADKKIFVLKFLFGESLNTKLFRQILDKSSTKLARKFLGIDSLGRFYWGFPSSSANCGIVINGNLPLETTNVNLCAHTTTQSQREDCGIWYLFQSKEEISSLVDYLNTNDPEVVNLSYSILQWQNLILHEGRQTSNNLVERHMVYSTDLNKSPPNCLATKATVLLEAKRGSKSLMKPRKRKMAKCYRCDCLELVFPSQYHCVKCHETFFEDVEFEQHKSSSCVLSLLSAEISKINVGKCTVVDTVYYENLPKSMPSEQNGRLVRDQLACSISEKIRTTFGNDDSGIIVPDKALAAKKPGVVACLDQIALNTWLSKSDPFNDVGKFVCLPESSKKPLVGNARLILRQLKINLLDMEAALPNGAKRPSRASPEWRSAWCAFVKSSNTIYEMVEAILVLETMIKTEHINNTWWWYWSSVSVAAQTFTMSALALRIYTLDAAIDYQNTAPGPAKNSPRKRKQTSEKVKKEKKSKEEK